MTTVTAPPATYSPLRVPTPREIWSLARMDPSVAKTLIICAAIVAVALLGAFAYVASTAGDVVGVATALGLALTAVGTVIARYRWGGNGNGTTRDQP